MSSAPPRLGRLQATLVHAGLDGAILFGADAVCHLTGYWRYLGGSGAVIVPAHGSPTLLMARDEETLIDPGAPVAEVAGYGAPGWAIERDPDRAMAEALRERTSQGRWGVAFGALAPGVAARLGEMADVSDQAMAVRRVKDADEVDRIADATRLTHLGQRVVQEYLESAAPTEIGALSRAHAAMQEAAGEVIEVVSDMIAGDHAAGAYAPIAAPGPRPIAPGEALISDLLVRFRGYWGQSTRTLGRGSIADSEAARAVEAARAALVAGRAALRPGATAGDLDTLLRAELDARLAGARCPHHTGHGLGLSFADAPQVVPGEPTVLEEGMVLSLSPGIYSAGRYGIRIADVYLVGASGGQALIAGGA